MTPAVGEVCASCTASTVFPRRVSPIEPASSWIRVAMSTHDLSWVHRPAVADGSVEIPVEAVSALLAQPDIKAATSTMRIRIAMGARLYFANFRISVRFYGWCKRCGMPRRNDESTRVSVEVACQPTVHCQGICRVFSPSSTQRSAHRPVHGC